MTKNQQLNIFKDFLKIKSISADKKYIKEMYKAQDFLTNLFKTLSFETKILKCKKFDAVFAQKIINKDLPTVLVYGHYDVMPPEPLDEWKSDPFKPEIRNNKIFARGATDDKGQILAHILAVEKLISETKNNLPVNIKFIIEGEEETGSESVGNLTKKYAENLFKCDYLILSDNEMVAPNKPSIDISLRGIIYLEIKLNSGEHDLHSGQFGGICENPANILAQIISKLKDEKGNILIPGFYDNVKPFPKNVLKEFKKIKVSKKSLKHEGEYFVVGGGEERFTLNERRWARPTLDVNGLTSGYQGKGSKTIIPCKASAKISMRLVADQNPDRVFNIFSKFVKSLVPTGIKIEIVSLSGSLPYQAPTNNEVFEMAKKALKESYKNDVLYTGMGGTIGFVPILANKLKVPCLMIGFALPTDNLHAPNEHFHLNNFYKGIETMFRFYKKLGQNNE